MVSALSRYRSGDLNSFLKDIDRYSIGLDRMFNHLGSIDQDVNYPPYNLVKEDDNNYSLEIALAGFNSDEVKVYTEINQLFVEASKKDVDGREYVHRGLASRSFTRSWTLSEDVEVTEVNFVDGILSVSLRHIVPEKHQKRLWFGSES